MDSKLAFPPGHFYSPIVDVAELAARSASIWPDSPLQMLGLDFNDESHIWLLRDVFPGHLTQYDYPEDGSESDPSGFFTANSQYSWLDARAYFVFLRHFRPRRVIEVGAGFSTMLLDDVNSRFLDRRVDILSIEPYPRPWLKRLKACKLVSNKVQDVDIKLFEDLGAGDILFIDSSHVAKTGSDVNFLIFEVLPRLRRGVLVHVHDVFLPAEYPREWVLTENRSWNEQYLIRALLMFSNAFHIVFGSSYAFLHHQALVRAALALPGEVAFGGGSLWIRKN